MHENSVASIIVEKPLVFLCGPNYDGKDKHDRRSILRNTLSKKDVIFKIENEYGGARGSLRRN